MTFTILYLGNSQQLKFVTDNYPELISMMVTGKAQGLQNACFNIPKDSL